MKGQCWAVAGEAGVRVGRGEMRWLWLVDARVILDVESEQKRDAEKSCTAASPSLVQPCSASFSLVQPRHVTTRLASQHNFHLG